MTVDVYELNYAIRRKILISALSVALRGRVGVVLLRRESDQSLYNNLIYQLKHGDWPDELPRKVVEAGDLRRVLKNRSKVRWEVKRRSGEKPGQLFFIGVNSMAHGVTVSMDPSLLAAIREDDPVRVVMPDQDVVIRIEDVTAETAKAYLIESEGGEMWIPKSQVRSLNTIDGTITVSSWWATRALTKEDG